jgi:polyhydroxyalkanoate synthase
MESSRPGPAKAAGEAFGRVAPPNGYGEARAALSDAVRQAQGDILQVLGYGPAECEYTVLASGPGWRLRAYGGEDGGRPLLIVAAPIKRPYIWDLAPGVSVVRRLLDEGLCVYLVEWTPPTHDAAQPGLDEHVDAIGACLARVRLDAAGPAPILVGHSLGGSLAAVFASFAPRDLGGLILLSSPLCFGESLSPFRDRLVEIAPLHLPTENPVPGSALTQASALASPETFVWSRLFDAAASLTDFQALGLHARVSRWALDEVPVPGALTAQILRWLYREDRFRRGVLPVKGRLVGPSDLSTPTLAVVDAADDVAPSGAVKPFLDAAPAVSRLIEHAGETGVVLQHLAVLIGREAHRSVWPEIVAWIGAQR